VLLDPEVVSQAPAAADRTTLAAIEEALDRLNVTLDRFIAAVRNSADDYAAAAARLEQGG
jgi:hypothetical protein